MSMLFDLRCETLFVLYLSLILLTISQVYFIVVLLFSIDTYCCQLARLFSQHARLALAILILFRLSADLLSLIASLYSVLNQGLQ